eukprot:UN04490
MPVKSKHLSFDNNDMDMDGEGEGKEEGGVLKRSASINDMDNMDMDRLKVVNNRISIQDLPTQANDSPDLAINEENDNGSIERRKTLLTPDIIDDDKNKIIPSPLSIKSKDTMATPQSVRSLDVTPMRVIRQQIHNDTNNTMTSTVPETQ